MRIWRHCVQAVKAGELLKTLVDLVGGSTSGFSAVVGAYVTTITATIAIAAICTLLAIMMYAMRADQRLRQDLRYGGNLHCEIDGVKINDY